MRCAHAYAAAVIAAPAADIYAMLADYRTEHSRILPPQYFSDLQIEAGGIGAGTVFQVRTHVLGIEQRYHMIVSEPRPGRVLAEIDPALHLAKRFTLTPLDADHTWVQIATAWEAARGMWGIIDQLVTPLIMRRVFVIQLRHLAAYVDTKRATTSTTHHVS
jgi:hypothetical protein